MTMWFYPRKVTDYDLQYSHMSMRWIQDLHGHIQRNHDPSGWKQDRQTRRQYCSEVMDTRNRFGVSSVLPRLDDDCVVVESHWRIIFDIFVALGFEVSSKISHVDHRLKRLVSRPVEIQNKYIPKVLCRATALVMGVPRCFGNVIYVIITSSEPTHTPIGHHTSRIMMGLCFCRVPWSTRGPKGVMKSHWQGHSSRGNVLSWWIWGFELFVALLCRMHFQSPWACFIQGPLIVVSYSRHVSEWVSKSFIYSVPFWYGGLTWLFLIWCWANSGGVCVSSGWFCFLL